MVAASTAAAAARRWPTARSTETRPTAPAVGYVATKASQIGLTKALAVDLAPEGIRVNAVCPGAVMTPLMREWAASQGDDPEQFLESAARSLPMRRMATPEEIGEVCAFLASDEAAYMTGQAICPEGGATLG